MYCLNTLDEPQYLSSIFDEDNNNMQMAITSSKESYKSDECHFESEWDDNFTGGMPNNHTGEKPFKCNVTGCDRSFSWMDNCKTHILNHKREKSSVKKTFKCNVTRCDRSFIWMYNCKTHILTHKREKLQ